MRMNLKQFFNIIGGYWYRPAMPPATAASLTLRVERKGVEVRREGRLDAAVSDAVNDAIRSHGIEIDATVLSYGTPIGWRCWYPAHNHAGLHCVWIVSRDRHSVTTSRHRNRLRAAVGQRIVQWPHRLDGIAKIADIYG